MTSWKGEEITPENMDRIADDIEKEWQIIKEKMKEKPSWMIDENSTYGEVLEFHAVTIPFKYEQLIEIEENAANRLSELAKSFKNPKDRGYWLKSADQHRRHANEMRLKLGMFRKNAERARKELEGLI
jgi:hypothetical protein